MEDRTDRDCKKRKDPQRNEVTVCERDRSRHYQSRKGDYPVLGAVCARIGSVREPRNDIKQGIDAERDQDPECNILLKRLSEIIDNVVIDSNACLKDQTHDRHNEKQLLKFKPYRSLQIPHRGIASRLGVHIKTP